MGLQTLGCYAMQAICPKLILNSNLVKLCSFKLKSGKISFVHNFRFSCPISLKFRTEHGSDTAVLCAKFQNDWLTEACVIGKPDFVRFGFKMCFGRISHIAQGPDFFEAHICNKENGSMAEYKRGQIPLWCPAGDVMMMETLSTLLTFCEGNLPVTGGFPSQRFRNVELWYFFVVNLYKLLNK